MSLKLVILLFLLLVFFVSFIPGTEALGEACRENSDCSTREICQNGKCSLARRPIPVLDKDTKGCRTTLNCNSGEICIAGKCTELTTPVRRVDRDPISCGSYITESVTLNSDDPVTQEACNFDGLVVGEDGITIDCNGHTIRGKSFDETRSYTKGVSLFRRSGVTILNCNFDGFEYGVQISQGNRNNILNNNFTGILSQTFYVTNASSNIFKGNVVRKSDGVLIGDFSTGNRFTDNYFSQVSTDSEGRANHFIYVGLDMGETTNQFYKNDLYGEAIIVDTGLITYCVDGVGNYYADLPEYNIPPSDCPPSEPWTDYTSDNLGDDLTEEEDRISCGEEVKESVTLTEEDPVTQEVCEGDGLKILNDNVVLDCNGLQLRGLSPRLETSTGVLISGARLSSVKNCVIDGFTYGVHLNKTMHAGVRDSHFKNIGSYATVFTNAQFGSFKNNIVEGGNGLDFVNTNRYRALGNQIFQNYFSTNLRYMRVDYDAGNQVYRNDFLGRGIIDDPYNENFYCLGNKGNYYGPEVPASSRKVSSSCNATSSRWTDYLLEDESFRVSTDMPDVETECELNTNCGENEFCLNGECIASRISRPNRTIVADSCKLDSDCSRGESCVLGKCAKRRIQPVKPEYTDRREKASEKIKEAINDLFDVKKEEKPKVEVVEPEELEPAFSTSEEAECQLGVRNCPSGEFCISGECLTGAELAARLVQSCEEDSDCDSGEKCREGKCRAIRQPRPIPESVNATPAPSRCSNDDQCPDEPGHEGFCVDGQCVLRQPISCETRDDCFGWLCINNRCIEPASSEPETPTPDPLDWIKKLIEKVQAAIGFGGGPIDSTCSETPPSCFEGATCCSDGTWKCNRGDASSSCPRGGPTDPDEDGVQDSYDNCPEDYNPNQRDFDHDEIGDVCDISTEEVITCTTIDDCPTFEFCFEESCVSFTDYLAARDNDDDGLVNGEDNCPNNYNPTQADRDGDEIGDACDPDDDTPPSCECGVCGDGTVGGECRPGRTCYENVCRNPSDVGDSDSDGVINEEDNCPDNYNPGQADADTDGTGDACDTPEPECVRNSDCRTGEICRDSECVPEPVDTVKRIIIVNDLEMMLDEGHANIVTDVKINGVSYLEILTIYDYCILDWWRCTPTEIIATCDNPFYAEAPFFEDPPCGEHEPDLHDLLVHGVRLLIPNPTLQDSDIGDILDRSDTYFNYLEIPVSESLDSYSLEVDVGIWEDISYSLREAFTWENHPDFSAWAPRIEESTNCAGARIIEEYTFPVEHPSGTLVIKLSDYLPSDGRFRESGYC